MLLYNYITIVSKNRTPKIFLNNITTSMVFGRQDRNSIITLLMEGEKFYIGRELSAHFPSKQ